jgi:UDP-glucose 4-epimerase
VIPKFIKLISEGKSPIIYGDGSQSRDFTFVSNNVEANILACTAPNVAGQVFNIACGERYTLIDLVNNINSILGSNVQPIFETERVGDVKHSMAGIEKAKDQLGFKIQTSFTEGLHKLIMAQRPQGR